MRRRLSRQSRAVVDAVGEDGAYGYAVVAATGLKQGTVYPILRRLEDAGRLVGEWEVGDPRVLGRPLRKFYRLPESACATTTTVQPLDVADQSSTYDTPEAAAPRDIDAQLEA